MYKRRLHPVWTKFRTVNPWFFVGLTLLGGIICVSALRANNVHMLKLRDAVYQADKDNGDTNKALQNLQAYVTRHMNTDLTTGAGSVYPPIQLKYTYDRLVQAQSAQNGSGNSRLYTDAENYCQQQDPVDFSGHNRVPCIEQYVQTHASVGAPVNNIPDALYKFDFITPGWSPDVAGWSLVTTVIFGLITLLSFGARLWSKHFVTR